jgi:hypothetical protein
MELEALSGLFSMPFRTYLDRHTFDGETIRQMGIAFEMALAALGFTPGCDDHIRRTLAQSIIERAQYGERDPERLCEGALQAVSSAVQRDSPQPRWVAKLSCPSILPAEIRGSTPCKAIPRPKRFLGQSGDQRFLTELFIARINPEICRRRAIECLGMICFHRHFPIFPHLAAQAPSGDGFRLLIGLPRRIA